MKENKPTCALDEERLKSFERASEFKNFFGVLKKFLFLYRKIYRYNNQILYKFKIKIQKNFMRNIYKNILAYFNTKMWGNKRSNFRGFN